MRRVPRPTHDARSTFELCARGVRETRLKGRLLSIADLIAAAAIHYAAHGDMATLFEILPEENVNNCVTRAEMINIYEGHFSRLGSRSRYIYDAIRTSTKNGICPLCGHRVVATLDHYLPKSLHPLFAVMPLNLIPACSDCNKAKLNRHPLGASDQTLHPYFDDVTDGIWLKASLIEDVPPAITFHASPPDCWSELKRNRVSHHFKTFGLSELYSANAAVELVQIEFGLRKIADSAGVEAVRLHLVNEAESRHNCEPNSWQAALYRTLAESEWFFAGGHRWASIN